MSAADIVGSVFRITSELAPVIGKLIASGVTEHALTSTLIAAAQSTAVERVQSRAGRVVSPSAVEAVHQRDSAERLRALGRGDLAVKAEDIARELRGDEPTSERPLPDRSER